MLPTATLLAAEAKTEKRDTLSDIRVTSIRERAIQRTTAEEGATAEVEAVELKDQIAYSPADLFRYEPGILTTNNGRFGLAGFNVRGNDDNRVSIQLDGLEMPESYEPTSSYLNAGRLSVDLASLSGASVVKGGDARHGSGFATVNLRLQSPEDFLSPSGDDSYASVMGGYRSDNDGLFENITLAGRRGSLESLLVATNRNADATKNHVGDGKSDDTRGTARREPDPGDVDNYDVLWKLQKVSDNSRIGLIAQKYRISSKLHLFSEEGRRYDDYHSDDNITRLRLGIYQDLAADMPLFDDLHWQLDWQRSETVNQSDMIYAGYNRQVEREYDQTTWQLKSDLSKEFTFGVPQQVAYGAVIKRDGHDSLSQDRNLDAGTVAKSRFSPRGDATRFGVYLQDRLALADGRVSLTPAIRYDSYRYDLDDDALVSQDYDGARGDAFTGQLGGTFDLTPAVQLFGKTGWGFRAPSYDELYYDYNGGRGYRIVANPDLKDERSRFVEAGVRTQSHLGSAELTGFYTDYRDFIESGVSASIDPSNYPYGEFTTENVDRALIRGVEFRGQLDLAEAFGAIDGLYGRIAAAYIEGKNLKDGSALETIPPVQAVVGLGYQAPSQRWGGELTGTFVNHVSDHDADGASFAPAAYQLYDMTAHVALGQHLTLRGGIFNLADKKYWVWDDVRGLNIQGDGLDRYTQPGRNFGVSAQYVF